MTWTEKKEMAGSGGMMQKRERALTSGETAADQAAMVPCERIITGIEELSGSRSRVYLDGEFAFVLYKGEVRRYHLLEGEALAAEVYEQIMQEVLPKRAKLRAMNLLLKRDYTTSQLRDKLRQGGYPFGVVETALEYVASYHYTDDLRYAVSFMTCHQHDRSRLRIEQDLRVKGIPDEVIGRAWEQWETDGGRQDEEAMIAGLLQKRNYDPEKAGIHEKQREYAFLIRKGFSAESVKKAVFGRIGDFNE